VTACGRRRWSGVLAAPPPTLCLDFVNTRYWRGRATPTETLADFTALNAWAERALPLPGEAGALLRDWADRDPAAATALHAGAVALRELLHRIFAGLATAEPATPHDLARLNAQLGQAPQRVAIARQAAQYGWRVELRPESGTGLLAPVLWSAGDLLARSDHDRLRRCANPECLWLFLDESRGGTRRWCDMGACGNRAKARRHYLRNKPSEV